MSSSSPRLVVVEVPADLPTSARDLVRLVVGTLTAADGVPVVLHLTDVDEPAEAQALVLQEWCLADHPPGHELPEIQLLGDGEARDLPGALHLRAGTSTADAQRALQDVLVGAPVAAPGAAGTVTRLRVVLVADQTPPAVAHSLRAHLVALQEVQHLPDVVVDVVLVDQHPDPGVLELLRLVDGAELLQPGRLLGVGTSWNECWAAGASDLLLLSTTSSVPQPDAVRRLVETLLADRTAQVALPGSSAPAAALVRTSALHRLRTTHGRAVAGSKHAVLALTRLTRRAQDAGLACVVVDDARFGGVPVRQGPTVLRPGWCGASLSLAHADAATAGPWTYFTGGGARLVTYEPYERIEIGAYCSIADEVRLVNPGRPDAPVTDRAGRHAPVPRRDAHRVAAPTTFPVGNRFPGLDDLVDSGGYEPGSGDVLRVGNDVWIGFGATLLGAVTVGHGAVVGAGAVVTKDVPPYAVVAGNPARVVRSRVPEELVGPMLDIAWWDWPEDLVLQRAGCFTRPVEEFVAEFHPAARLVRR